MDDAIMIVGYSFVFTTTGRYTSDIYTNDFYPSGLRAYLEFGWRI